MTFCDADIVREQKSISAVAAQSANKLLRTYATFPRYEHRFSRRDPKLMLVGSHATKSRMLILTKA